MNMLQHQQMDSSYHNDIILQLAAAYGQLQVSHGPETVLQRSAAVIYNVFHREVICCGPAFIVLIPGQCNRLRMEQEQKKFFLVTNCNKTAESTPAESGLNSLICISDQIHFCEQLSPGEKSEMQKLTSICVRVKR